MSIIAHVDHGKTTLSDSFLAAAGIISQKMSGQDLEMDQEKIEQERQMTIKASNVSLVHAFKEKKHLINFIDTPGHIDFNAAVIRSLRVVDGALVVVDAVEGPRTQTETVLMQALRERVKPILFINKVDRLITQLKLAPEEIQRKFAETVSRVNKLIEKYASPEHKKDWQVKVEDGSVAFGSALHNWGLNLPHMKAKRITFKEIMDAYTGDKDEVDKKVEALKKKAPVYEPLLDMFCELLPSPIQAQPYRQAKIWPGDTNSPVGKSMANVDPNGPLLICISTVRTEKEGGALLAIGRVFSGTVEKGRKVQLLGSHQKGTIQQTYTVMIYDKLSVERVPAGSMVGVTGLPRIRVGETVAEEGLETQPFEELEFVSDPVVTVAVEPEELKDMQKFVESMHKLAIEDPSLQFTTNKESGEHLISGMGELHLEITVQRLQEEKLAVRTSKPIVIYRETIGHDYTGPPIMGKSPNKHSKLWITLEKLSDEVIEAIKRGRISEMQTREDRQRILKQLGWSTDDARSIVAIEGNNVLVNRIKGRQYVDEVMSHIRVGFSDAVNASVLAKEPAFGLKVSLVDITVHEDPVHRGPAQVIPMTRRPIWCVMLLSDPQLLEPLMAFECSIPSDFQDFISKVEAIVQKRRGKVLDVINEEGIITIKAEMPVSESFGLSKELRSSTQGRVFRATQFSRWTPIPTAMQASIVMQIRKRRALTPTPPQAEEFYEQA